MTPHTSTNLPGLTRRKAATLATLIAALLAADRGVAGIVVSNHGGRPLDTTGTSRQALPRIADAVGGRLPLLFDGGIGRGTAVLKALALGVSAVLIGRPYIYGLATARAVGVARVQYSPRRTRSGDGAHRLRHLDQN